MLYRIGVDVSNQKGLHREIETHGPRFDSIQSPQLGGRGLSLTRSPLRRRSTCLFKVGRLYLVLGGHVVLT